MLEQAGLVERKVEARYRVCSLRRERLSEAQAWIGQVRDFWDQSFERLDALLETQDNQGKEKPWA